jgi:CBS domain-containing protein
MEPLSADRPISTLTGDTPVEIAPEATVAEVARLLVDADIGVVLVSGGAGPAGVVSERDIVRAVADGLDLATVPCTTVAATDLVRCDAHATAGEVAALMMEHWVRHVLVESGGALVGVVSARDLLGVVAGDLDEGDDVDPMDDADG